MQEETKAEPTNAAREVTHSVRERIQKVLSIYPGLSHSMLQVGLGPGMPPALWRPVLDQMIEDGEVVEEDVSAPDAAGRTRSYRRIRLPGVSLNLEA